MNAGRRRVAGAVVILVLPAVLAFTVVRLLGTGDGGEHRAAPSDPGAPARTDGSGPAVDVVARFAGPEDGAELTFQIGRDQAEAGPPEDIRDCRRFAEWAARNGGVPVGVEPAHVLSVHARRSLDVNGVSVVAVPVGQVPPTWQDGPWVELACRDATPTPAASPGDPGWPPKQEDSDEQPDRPLVLTAGQTIELPVALDTSYDTGEAFPHGLSDYQLDVRIEIDGITERHRLRNGSSSFRCCGRTTFMGFQAARYEWRLTPSRSLRYCAELRYAEAPPPPKCETRQR
ncbi:hypothetical protein [Micromonospora sp. NPDC092111]|uniref:hypothetical protein n=1 Tax=Micromonospora sp. NPDC092111 TaxID=3364289 RepID=UPI0037FEAACF